MIGMGRAGGRARAGAGLAIALLVSPPLVSAFRTGPRPGLTGGFGEPTCHACHFDHAIGDPAGALRVAGLPESYTRGVRYSIRVALRRPGTQRAGFQLAVRFADGPDAGRAAGTLEPEDGRVEIVSGPDGRAHYAQHTSGGSEPTGAAEAHWSVAWAAPGDGGYPVVLHVAANAGNGDESPLGDFVYLGEARSAPR